MAIAVTFICKDATIGTVTYEDDGKLTYPSHLTEMVQNWALQGQKPEDFVPHYLGWTNGYMVGIPPEMEGKSIPGITELPNKHVQKVRDKVVQRIKDKGQ